MATSIIKTDEIRRLNDQVLMSDGALTSNVVFPAGHVVQTVSNFENGVVTASTGSISTSASNIHSGYILVVSVGLTFKTTNPNILVYAYTGEIDICDGRMSCRLFYHNSAITDVNINNTGLFETTYGQNQARVCAEIGRGVNNVAESHRPGASYYQMLQINGSIGDNYYFALGMGRMLTSGSCRVGNGSSPQIVVSEIKS